MPIEADGDDAAQEAWCQLSFSISAQLPYGAMSMGPQARPFDCGTSQRSLNPCRLYWLMVFWMWATSSERLCIK